MPKARALPRTASQQPPPPKGRPTPETLALPWRDGSAWSDLAWLHLRSALFGLPEFDTEPWANARDFREMVESKTLFRRQYLLERLALAQGAPLTNAWLDLGVTSGIQEGRLPTDEQREQLIAVVGEMNADMVRWQAGCLDTASTAREPATGERPADPQPPIVFLHGRFRIGDGEPVKLRRKALDALHAIADSKERGMSVLELKDRIGCDSTTSDETIRQHVCRARKALRAATDCGKFNPLPNVDAGADGRTAWVLQLPK